MDFTYLNRGTGGCKGFNNRVGCGVGDGSGCGLSLDEGHGLAWKRVAGMITTVGQHRRKA